MLSLVDDGALRIAGMLVLLGLRCRFKELVPCGGMCADAEPRMIRVRGDWPEGKRLSTPECGRQGSVVRVDHRAEESQLKRPSGEPFRRPLLRFRLGEYPAEVRGQ